jgi:hypothetical protein
VSISRLLSSTVALTAAVALTMSATPPHAAPSTSAADRLVASAPAVFKTGAGDQLHRTGVLAGTHGLQYLTYDRTYRGLPAAPSSTR